MLEPPEECDPPGPGCTDMCVRMELDCSNVADDDQDGRFDCFDSDCVGTAACTPGAGAPGTPCDAPSDCQGGPLNTPLCASETATGFPGGACGYACTVMGTECELGTACLPVTPTSPEGVCLPSCMADTDCSAGYKCDTNYGVCMPGCTADTQCTVSGNTCIEAVGRCGAPEADCDNFMDDNMSQGPDCFDFGCRETLECTGGITPSGFACSATSQCFSTGGDPVCIAEATDGWPGGTCSELCSTATNDCGTGSTCLVSREDPAVGFCLQECSFAPCRPGYQCANILGLDVCVPGCMSDAECTDGRICGGGICITPPVCGDGTVEFPETCDPPNSTTCNANCRLMELCDNQQDDDLDGALDCIDSECRGTPACTGGSNPLGAACTLNSDCRSSDGDPVCAAEATLGFPGGYCSQGCDLRAPDCGATGQCVPDFSQPNSGFCMVACTLDPMNPQSTCRDGYECTTDFGIAACTPRCTSDSQCTDGRVCQDDAFLPMFGRCIVAPPCGDNVVEFPETCDPPDGVICDNSCNKILPTGWTCGAMEYGDGVCDCGCGVQDADCAATDVIAECMRCNAPGSCSPPFAGCPGLVDPLATTACTAGSCGDGLVMPPEECEPGLDPRCSANCRYEETDCSNGQDDDFDQWPDCLDADCAMDPACAAGAGALGDACTATTDCSAFSGAPFCATEPAYGWPAGYCLESCDPMVPGPTECGPDGFCEAADGVNGLCLLTCRPSMPPPPPGTPDQGDCRTGYMCAPVPDPFGMATVTVCIPGCTSNADCSDGRICQSSNPFEPTYGRCIQGPTCGNDIVEPGEECEPNTSAPGQCNPDCTLNVPSTWTCSRSWYFDASCDCGCGELDPTCIDATADSCEFCLGCSAGFGCPGSIDPTNNAVCVPPVCGDGIVSFPTEQCEPGMDPNCDPMTCLRIERECDNQADDDFDGLADCGDSDCQADPVCSGGTGATGTACTSAADCASDGNDPVCFSEASTGWPGGGCTQYCVNNSECGGGNICVGADAQLGLPGFCYDACNPAGPNPCTRPGYACLPVGSGVPPLDACQPRCTEDAQCAPGNVCVMDSAAPDAGLCVPAPVCGNLIVEPGEQCDRVAPSCVNCMQMPVPTEWTCNPRYWGGGPIDGCDCGCGIPDPDCSAATSDVCQYCLEGSCSPFGCTAIDPTDNAVCLPSQCGDGMVSGQEQCDPPNAFDCTATCMLLTEDCVNGRDDNGNGHTDCLDPECAPMAYCIPGDSPTGAACLRHRDCDTASGTDPFCQTAWPSGYCSEGCMADTDCSAGSICVQVGGEGYCAVACTSDSDCRSAEGYTCGPFQGSLRDVCHFGP